MNKAPLLLFCCLLVLTACTTPKKVTEANKALLQESLKQIMVKNQQYRGLIQWGTFRQEKVDSIQSLSVEAMRAYLLEPEFELTPDEEDSLRVLQNQLDKENTLQLMDLVKKYGWLSQEKLDLPFSPSRLLFNTPVEQFEDLRVLLLKEVKEKRMPGLDFAKFVDNLLLKQDLKQLYGTINPLDRQTGRITDPLIDDLAATNAARQEIGLKNLEKYRLK